MRSSLLLPLALAWSLAACGGNDLGGGSIVSPASDSAAPVVTVLFPSSDVSTDAASIEVRGVAHDASTIRSVKVNGIEAQSADGDAHWHVRIPLHPGTNSIAVQSEDIRGNSDPTAASLAIRRSGPILLDILGCAVDAPRSRWIVSDGVLSALFAVDANGGGDTLLSGVGAGSGVAFAKPWEVAVDGDSAYVTDPFLGALFRVDLTTGDRTIVSGAGVGSGPILSLPLRIALDPAHARAFVSQDFSQCRIVVVDLATGARAPLEGAGAPAYAQVGGLLYDAALNRLFVTDAFDHALFTVGVATGIRAPFFPDADGPAFVSPRSVCFGDLGTRLFLNDAGLEAIVCVEISNGKRAIVSDATHGQGPDLAGFQALAESASAGEFVFTGGDRILRMSLATGDRSFAFGTQRGIGPELRGPEDVAFDPVHGRVLVLDADGLRTRLVAVDPASGARAILPENAAVGDIFPTRGLALDRGAHVALTVGPDASLDHLVVYGFALPNGGLHTYADLPAAAPDVTDIVLAAGTRRLLLASDVGLDGIELSSGRHVPISGPKRGAGIGLNALMTVALPPQNGQALVVAYAPDLAARVLARIDLATGDRAVVSGPTDVAQPEFIYSTDMAVDAARGRALVVDGVRLIAVDLANGERSVIVQGTPKDLELPAPPTRPSDGHGPAFDSPYGIALDAARGVAYTTHGSYVRYVLALDLESGDRVLVSR